MTTGTGPTSGTDLCTDGTTGTDVTGGRTRSGDRHDEGTAMTRRARTDGAGTRGRG